MDGVGERSGQVALAKEKPVLWVAAVLAVHFALPGLLECWIAGMRSGFRGRERERRTAN